MNQPFTTYELTLNNIREILNIDELKIYGIYLTNLHIMIIL